MAGGRLAARCKRRRFARTFVRWATVLASDLGRANRAAEAQRADPPLAAQRRPEVARTRSRQSLRRRTSNERGARRLRDQELLDPGPRPRDHRDMACGDSGWESTSCASPSALAPTTTASSFDSIRAQGCDRSSATSTPLMVAARCGHAVRRSSAWWTESVRAEEGLRTLRPPPFKSGTPQGEWPAA
jgi:hypothetical protein